MSRVNIQSFVLAVALCGLLWPAALTSALGQSVTSRAASNDESRIGDSDDGHSRSIYSQKHLSPHRMMHFGKRPLVQAPPAILDLYRQPPTIQSRLHRAMLPGRSLPYTLYFDMPRDQVLEFVQPNDPKVQLIEAVPDLLEYAERSQQQQQQQPIDFGEEDSFELSNGNNVLRDGGGMVKKQSLMANNENQQTGANNAGGGGGQPEQQDASGASNGQQDGDGISVVSRSIASHSDLPFQGIMHQPDISSYLFGRRISADPQSTALLTLGSFIKKAEPQRNTMKFMHFGR